MTRTPSGPRPDVIVVGAGPAGSTAAWRLAREGVRVLIIDGTRFPRSKPCGDCLSPGATPLLDRMGMLPELARRGAREVRGWRFDSPNGRSAQACFGPVRAGVPDRGIALSRRILDDALLDAAVQAGAEFRAPLRVFDVVAAEGSVELRARDEEGREVGLGAPRVIGADGLRSVVARRVTGIRRGRRDRLALVGRYRPLQGRLTGHTDPSAGIGELRLTDDGCIGAAEIERGLWNVTLVVPRARAREISAAAFEFYRESLSAHGFRPPNAPGDLVTGLEVTGPFEFTPAACAAPGLVLAGDAAGYFDPFTGQGIYRALVTGDLAAEATIAALAEPHRAPAIGRAYEVALRRRFGSTRRLQRLVDHVIHRRRLADAAGFLLALRPGLLTLLLDATGDRDRPSALVRPARLVPVLRNR